MKHLAHILLVGNDARLLNERAALLFNFWAIAAVSAFDDAAQQLGWADCVVLCHSVTYEQRNAWISNSRDSNAARPIVSIELKDLTDPSVRIGADSVVSHDDGPAALVSSVYELLTERGLESKHWVNGRQTLLYAEELPGVAS